MYVKLKIAKWPLGFERFGNIMESTKDRLAIVIIFFLDVCVFNYMPFFLSKHELIFELSCNEI